MNSGTDRDLVARMSHGDRNAFAALMIRHGAAVYRYSWRLADEPSQVDDLVQDTFFILWKRRRAVTLAGDSALPWLLTTCRFTAFNSNRRARARRTVRLDSVENATPDAALAAARDELRWVHDEIAALSEIDRRLVERCLLEGVSYADAAAELGISGSAARKRIQRTRSRLAQARAENS